MPSPVADTLAPDPATPVDPPQAHALEALPVAVGAGPVRDRLRRYVEGELGWQVVPVDEADLPARVVLATVRTERTSPVPYVLVVEPSDDATTAARACVRLQPDAVVAWPDGRVELPQIVAGLLEQPVTPGAQERATVTTVGGAAGGVGTTTVAVALAAASAWAGRRTLALVRPPVALDVPVQPVDVRASARLWASASQLPGVRGARVACCVAGPMAEPGGVEGAAAVVLDRGTDTDVDVLVVRPDRVGLDSLRATVASVVIVNGSGPVSDDQLRRAAGGRRTISLERSARVARADLRGRGPAAYPGTWLRPLLPVARGPTG